MATITEDYVPSHRGWSDKDAVFETAQQNSQQNADNFARQGIHSDDNWARYGIQSDNNFFRSVSATRQGLLETNVWESRLQSAMAAGLQQLATAREGSETRAALAAQKDLDSRFQISALQTKESVHEARAAVGAPRGAMPVLAPAAITAGGVGLGIPL